MIVNTVGTQNQIKPKRSWLKVIAIVLGVLFALIALGVAWLFYTMEAPFIGAEAKMRQEYAAMNLPFGQPAFQPYERGECFDNCPLLAASYAANGQSMLQAAKTTYDQLIAAGYSSEYQPRGGLDLTKPETYDTLFFDKTPFHLVVRFSTANGKEYEPTASATGGAVVDLSLVQPMRTIDVQMTFSPS